MKKVTIGEFFTELAHEKRMTKKEMAEKKGRSGNTINTFSRAGGLNTKILIDILNSVDEDLVIKLKNGKEYLIVKNKD